MEHFSQQITQWEASWKQPELSLTSQPLTDFPWLFCYTKVCFFYTNQHQFWITVNTIAPEHRSQKTINKELIEIYSILHLQLTLRGYQFISIKSLLLTKMLKEILTPIFVTALFFFLISTTTTNSIKRCNDAVQLHGNSFTLLFTVKNSSIIQPQTTSFKIWLWLT